MRTLVSICFYLAMLGCDTRSSDKSGTFTINDKEWKQIPAPSYMGATGLYKTEDPENGNTIYIFIGQKEPSIFVVTPARKYP